MTANRLLILSCSQRKIAGIAADREIAAGDYYDGPAYRLLRSYLRQNIAPAGVAILSAEYGLMSPEKLIAPYERKLDLARAGDFRHGAFTEEARRVIEALAAGSAGAARWDEVFFFGGKLYREVIEAYATAGFFTPTPLTCASGGIGYQLGQLKAFLERCKDDRHHG